MSDFRPMEVSVETRTAGSARPLCCDTTRKQKTWAWFAMLLFFIASVSFVTNKSISDERSSYNKDSSLDSRPPEEHVNGSRKVDGTLHLLQSDHVKISREWWVKCSLYQIDTLIEKYLGKEFVNESIQEIGWEPVLDNDGEFVHHMDLFMCTDKIVSLFETPSSRDRTCDSAGNVFGPIVQASRRQCHAFSAIYDKGAKKIMFPDETGISIRNPYMLYTHMLLQIHYLNERYQTTRDGIEDTSGFRIFVVGGSLIRKESARIVGVIDDLMTLPPGYDRWTHTFAVPTEELERIMEEDWKMYGDEVRVVGAHLHAHDRCTRMTVFNQHRLHTNMTQSQQDPVKGDILSSIDPYGGYGESQQFLTLSPSSTRMLRKDDVLTVSCVYNTSSAQRTIRSGMSSRDEMCGPLFLVTPTNPEVIPERLIWKGSTHATVDSMTGPDVTAP